MTATEEAASANDFSRRLNEADILLVEDNPGDVRLLREQFEEGNIDNELHVAADGTEALDFLNQRGEFTDAPRPDIVLLDVDLPGRNGDEILAEINDTPALAHLPVIVLTGSDAQEDIVRSYDLDAASFLTKPVRTEEFIDAVCTLDRFQLSVVRVPDDERGGR